MALTPVGIGTGITVQGDYFHMVYALNKDRPFPEATQKDIGSLIDHLDGLAKILLETANQKPDFSPDAMFSAIAERLSMTFLEVSRLFSALENINEIRETIPQSTVIAALMIRRLSKDMADKLRQGMQTFVEILDIYSNDHPVHISIKAKKLSYLHENLYQDGEIITDVRPIFNTAGNSIREMVVTHSLVLNSFSYGTGGRRTHFALDATDLLRLRNACERAMHKAAVLKEALGGNQWTVEVLNETDDAH